MSNWFRDQFVCTIGILWTLGDCMWISWLYVCVCVSCAPNLHTCNNFSTIPQYFTPINCPLYFIIRFCVSFVCFASQCLALDSRIRLKPFTTDAVEFVISQPLSLAYGQRCDVLPFSLCLSSSIFAVSFCYSLILNHHLTVYFGSFFYLFYLVGWLVRWFVGKFVLFPFSLEIQCDYYVQFTWNGFPIRRKKNTKISGRIFEKISRIIIFIISEYISLDSVGW